MKKFVFSDTVLEKEISLPIGQTPIFDPETGYSYVNFTRVNNYFGKEFKKEERFYFDSCRPL
ncbi:hypothetical protein [Emticicia sp. W12TSBA100-4]|uniref:hypothetical protein n=1 Tax=Emticicia sp. W12TSBA100-4 TaxID=3160965 RepID=UPI003305DF59